MSVKRVVVVIAAVAAAVVVGLVLLGISALGPLRTVFNHPIPASANGGVVRIELQPVPEGPTISFERAPSFQGSKPLSLIGGSIPDPLPPQLGQWACHFGTDLVVTFGNGTQAVYGPCRRPASINRLWGLILVVTSIGASPSPSASPAASVPPSPAPAEFIRAVALVSPSEGWVVTDRRVLHTPDAGRSWRVAPVRFSDPVPIPPGEFFVDGSTAWLASGDTTVTVSRYLDGGTKVQTSVVPGNLSDGGGLVALSFLDANRGWVAVAPSHRPRHAVLYRTEDGGVTWNLVNGDAPTEGPIHFTSITAGWALGNPVLRTLDGGSTWQVQDVPATFDPALPGYFDALSLFGTNGVIEARHPTGMSGYPVYDVTSDGGKTWQERDPAASGLLGSNNTGPPLSFSAVDPEHWRASVYDHVAATDDGGRHWATVASNLQFGVILGLSFATPDAGWAFSVGNDADHLDCLTERCITHLEATNDGGRTWHEVRLPLA